MGKLSALLVIALLIAGDWCRAATPASAPRAAGSTVFVLILSRHGIRSPLETNAAIAKYAAQPWPAWGVGRGELTPHGAAAAKRMGAFYGVFYRSHGVIASGCDRRIYVYSDSEQRAIVTAKNIAAGIAGTCPLSVHHRAEGTADALIHTLGPKAPFLQADASISLQALKVAAPDPSRFLQSESTAFATLGGILECPSSAAPSCVPVTSLKFSEKADQKTGLAKLDGPLATGKSLAEIFSLEYANGTAAPGWGRATTQTIAASMALYPIDFALNIRPRYVAQALGSNLLVHISRTLAQVTGKSAGFSGAYAPPVASRMVIIAAHDTNLAAVAGILDLHWQLGAAYPADETPPTGALTFEVSETSGRNPTIALYYQAPSLDQMRNLTPLTLQAPPLRVRVPISGCGDPCTLSVFQSLVNRNINPKFVIAN